MNCSTPVSSVFQYLPELDQIHVTQLCYLTISFSATLFLPSVFPSIRFFSNEAPLHMRVSKILEIQHQSFQWIFRVDLLQDWLVWSCSPRDSQESSPTPQFKSINWKVIEKLYWKLTHPLLQKSCLLFLSISWMIRKNFWVCPLHLQIYV